MATRTLDPPKSWFEFDLTQVQRDYQAFRQAFWFLDYVMYAVKANPRRKILRTLQGEGCCFEIASAHELDKLLASGYNPLDVGRIVFSNPTRAESEIARAYKHGVRIFVVDCDDELWKFVRAPEVDVSQVKILVRLRTVFRGGAVASEGKAGVSRSEAVRLLQLAEAMGMKAHGVAFHVGSQQANPKAWKKPIEQCGQIIRTMRDESGILLEMIDLGGGWPVQYDGKPVPGWDKFASVVYDALRQHVLPLYPEGQRPTLVAEPGRALVARCGRLITEVVSVRPGRVICNVSAFHGVIEALESELGMKFPVLCNRTGRDSRKYALFGVSCDCQDQVRKRVRLPSLLKVGDMLAILMLGAYSVAYMGKPGAPGFNGFENPGVRYVNWTSAKSRRNDPFYA